ncbi:hypothetical protein FACS189426_02490 [Bacteroidia bacterium]|nr:hypothetical protein FACS189426_02490 [Bacteroidia bacterium]
MSNQGYTKGWPKEFLENRLHNALADTLRLVLDNKDLVYYMYSPEDIRGKLYMYMRVSKAATYDTFIKVTGRDDRWTLANSITEQGFAGCAWLGREGTDIAYYVLEMYCSDSPYTEKIITYGITFDIGKSTIKPESMGEINRIAKLMTDNPDLKFSVEGHTDNTGSAATNQTLSDARSKAVVDKLVETGISKDRLTSAGKGQNSPIADNSTDEGRAKNRRVEFIKIN